MEIKMRKNTKPIKCRDITIGAGSPIVIQSMTNTDTHDVESTLNQINQLHDAGCQIVRIAIPDDEANEAFAKIRKRTDIPLVADIHFDYRLAVNAIKNGADKVRINPGNIGSSERVKAVIDTAKEYGIPVRIGVNSGSLEKELLAKYGGVTPEGMCESVMKQVSLIESMNFDDIVISVKSSDIILNNRAYRLVSEKTDYPIHLGVTEAGTPEHGIVKSAIGIGALLLDGIGDTIRVSLTGSPLAEIPVAIDILKCTGNYNSGINYISCPTCSRCKTNLPEITNALSEKLKAIEMQMIKDKKKQLTVAIMGCAVNGPGEASNADIGVACGDKKGVIFKKGKIFKTVDESEILDVLFNQIVEELAEM